MLNPFLDNFWTLLFELAMGQQIARLCESEANLSADVIDDGIIRHSLHQEVDSRTVLSSIGFFTWKDFITYSKMWKNIQRWAMLNRAMPNTDLYLSYRLRQSNGPTPHLGVRNHHQDASLCLGLQSGHRHHRPQLSPVEEERRSQLSLARRSSVASEGVAHRIAEPEYTAEPTVVTPTHVTPTHHECGSSNTNHESNEHDGGSKSFASQDGPNEQVGPDVVNVGQRDAGEDQKVEKEQTPNMNSKQRKRAAKKKRKKASRDTSVLKEFPIVTSVADLDLGAVSPCA